MKSNKEQKYFWFDILIDCCIDDLVVFIEL